MSSNPQRSKVRRQLRTRDAIPLDEVEADFGMKGMLSFLQVPREEASRNLEARRAVDVSREIPIGQSPMGDTGQPTSADAIRPMGHVPVGRPSHLHQNIQPDGPPKGAAASQSDNIDDPLNSERRAPIHIGDFSYSVPIPDVGKRKPFRWTLAQDAHTAAEQTLFAAMMELSRRQGPKLPTGPVWWKQA